jgi:hypothetical protein
LAGRQRPRGSQSGHGSAGYQRHRPEQTLLCQIVEQHDSAFVDHLADRLFSPFFPIHNIFKQISSFSPFDGRRCIPAKLSADAPNICQQEKGA